MELLMLIVTHLPIVDLLTNGLQQATGNPALDGAGLAYDVGQALLGLRGIAVLAAKISDATPWTWDDGPAHGLLGATTSAVAWFTRNIGALDAKPKK